MGKYSDALFGEQPQATGKYSSTLFDDVGPPPEAAEATPDGRTVAPGTTPEMAADVPPGMVFDPRTGGYVDAALAAERMGSAQGANANFLAGAPFVGEYADEAMGRLDQALTGRNPEIAQETFRQSRGQFAEENPGTAAGLQVAGGVTGALPIVAAAPVALPAGMSTTQAAIVGGGAGMAAGAIEGASQGYGRGTTPETRRDEAVSGAMQGGIAGGALGTAGPVAYSAIKGAVRKFRKTDIRTISSTLGIGVPAARVIKEALKAEDFEAAEKAFRRAGDEAMLADAGQGAGALLDASTQTGGKALTTARTRVDQRAEKAQGHLTNEFNRILGLPKGVKSAAREIAEETRPQRSAAYNSAYEEAVNYSTGAFGEQVLGVIGRVPEDDLRKAVATANKLMQGTGKEYRQILLEEVDGKLSIAGELPSVMQLDYLKRGLNALAEENVDQFGRKTDLGGMYSGLARELRDTMRDNIPAYARALKVGGDKLEMDAALDVGRKLFSRGTSLEDVTEQMKGASQEARQAVATGIRNQLEAILSETRTVLSDNNLAAREAVLAVKMLSSRANREKLSAAIGGGKAKALLRKVDEAAAALELRAVIATNSKTAIRQSIQNEAKEAALPSTLRDVVGNIGNPFEASQKITQALLSVNGRNKTKENAEMFRQIADALTDVRGPKARQALYTINRAMRGQPVKEEQAKLVAKVLSEGGGTTLYEVATQ